MLTTAAAYEEKATDRIKEFHDKTTDNFENSNALKESHVFAMLAVASSISHCEDQLDRIRRDQALAHNLPADF